MNQNVGLDCGKLEVKMGPARFPDWSLNGTYAYVVEISVVKTALRLAFASLNIHSDGKF